ncbi:hypothetical protein C0995_000597 [Termitomyces sp. Mi166|nr:hypothetical protein C0995_000597 [Termitomyces sp. Mi166\
MAKALKKGKGKWSKDEASENEDDEKEGRKPKKLLMKIEASMKQSQLKVFHGITVPFMPEQEELVLLSLYKSKSQVIYLIKPIVEKYAVLTSDGWKDESCNAVTGVNLSVNEKIYFVNFILANSHKKDEDAMCHAFETMIDKAEEFQLMAMYYFVVNEKAALTTEKATNLIGWVHNHGLVHSIFNAIQLENSQKVLAFLITNMTHWNLHFIVFDCLQNLKTSIQLVVFTQRSNIIAAQVSAKKNQKKKKLSGDATKHYDLIENGGFWCQLKAVVDDLEPICLGLNMNQTDVMHPDQVLLSFTGIFIYFQKYMKKSVADGMMKKIEKCWKPFIS